MNTAERFSRGFRMGDPLPLSPNTRTTDSQCLLHPTATPPCHPLCTRAHKAEPEGWSIYKPRKHPAGGVSGFLCLLISRKRGHGPPGEVHRTSGKQRGPLLQVPRKLPHESASSWTSTQRKFVHTPGMILLESYRAFLGMDLKPRIHKRHADQLDCVREVFATDALGINLKEKQRRRENGYHIQIPVYVCMMENL